ncbi:MAG: hypothetical protein AB7S38_14910 [Vulcanimicrobiota bacterium]
MVPAHAIHLVAVGSCRGRQVVREAILHIPPFPYSIASNGRIEADRVLVGSVENLAAFENGLNPDELFPGHILSNATDSNGPALVLGQQCEVLGDARAVGSVDNHGLVRGQLRPFSEAQAIATIDPTTYDPRGQLNLRSLDSSFENRLSVAGPARRQGDLIVGDGLDLDGGLLYVDGDLVVHGGIRGQGAVVCTGRLEVHGGSQLTSTGLTALVAGGDVTLHGEGSVFTGLVATQGGFSADNLEVRGVLLAQGDMHLEDTRLYYAPEAGHIELEDRLNLADDTARLYGLQVSPLQISDFADGRGGYAWDPSKLSLQWTHPDEEGRSVTETFSDWQQLPPGPVRSAAARYWPRVESAWRTRIAEANIGHSGVFFRLDLDQLLSEGDRLRVVVWRTR